MWCDGNYQRIIRLDSAWILWRITSRLKLKQISRTQQPSAYQRLQSTAVVNVDEMKITELLLASLLGVILQVESFKICSHKRITDITYHRRLSFIYGATKNEYSDMVIDESKLSQSERDRLAFIQKLTLEADDIIKAAGFALDDEELDADIIQRPIKDTKWSGQSDVEESIRSRNNFKDVIARKGLAVGDISAVIITSSFVPSYFGEDTQVASVILSAAPFLLAWLVVSPFLGTFSRQSTSSKGAVPGGMFLGWLVSAAAAAAIDDKIFGLPLSQTVVSQIATFATLGLWRVSYISLIGETSDQEYKSAGFFEVFKMIKSLVKRW